MTIEERLNKLEEINKELLRMVLEQSRYIRAMEDAQKVRRVNAE